MKWAMCSCLGLGLLTWSIWAVAQEPSKAAKKSADVGRDKEKDEASIRATVAQFVKAYNAHDAKAVAELFLPEAQIVDEDDNTIQGRAEIESLFAGVFEETPETKIEVAIESIRFIGTLLAVEIGTTTTLPAAGATAERGRYSVLHVLRDGKWSMGLVRDMPAEPTGLDRYVFRSADRIVGNEVLPPVEVHVVRQPPQPK